MKCQHNLKFGFAFKRKLHQGVTAVQVEFERDVGAMCADGVRADAKLYGNFFAGFVFGE